VTQDWKRREKSMMPKTIMKNTIATRANSTMAWPLSPRARRRRPMRCDQYRLFDGSRRSGRLCTSTYLISRKAISRAIWLKTSGRSPALGTSK